MRDLMKAYPDLETWDEEQEDRLEGIALYVQEDCAYKAMIGD